MKVALDTSVIVAALWMGHRHHHHARRWVLPGEDPDLSRALGAHALAETWSVLTRLPVQPRIAPGAAEAMVAPLASVVEVCAVSAELQQHAFQRCARHGLTGGAVHDALHLAAAEHVQAEALVTFHAKRFERLRDPGSPRVVVPGAG